MASKYLHDDGELDSAINSEWAAAYGISVKTINQLEKDYLSAMVRFCLFKLKSYKNVILRVLN